MKLNVRFNFERETKGAVRFQEVDKNGNKKTNADGAVIGTLYLRKTALGTNVPQSLTVQISETE